VTNCSETVYSHDFTPLPSGEVFFVWGNDFNLYYKTFSLDIMEWSLEKQLTNSTRTADNPSVDSDKYGNVHLAYAGGDDGLTTHEVSYQYFNGDNWTLGKRIIISPIDEIHSSKPKILVDQRDVVNIIWSDDTDFLITDSFYCEIRNNTIDEIFRLNNVDFALYHDIFIDTNNNKHFVWLDGYHYRYRLLTNTGEWIEEIIVKDHNAFTFTFGLKIVVRPRNIINLFFTEFIGDSREVYYIEGRIQYDINTIYYLSSLAIILNTSFLIVIVFNFKNRNKK